VAGLSLGEYSALFAANMIDFDSALRLVTLRGRAMQDAAAAKPSTMLAVMGLGEAKAKELCDAAAQGEVLVCANFNAPGQIVLSGDIEACKRAEAMAGDFGWAEGSRGVPQSVHGTRGRAAWQGSGRGDVHRPKRR
jgi:[acyl-carrier-protein] S-malonyltransferase